MKPGDQKVSRAFASFTWDDSCDWLWRSPDLTIQSHELFPSSFRLCRPMSWEIFTNVCRSNSTPVGTENLKFTLNQFYAVNLSVQGHRLGSSHCGPKWNDQWNLQNLVPEGSCANSAFLFFYLWTNLSPRHVFWVEEMTRTSGGLR